MLSLSLHYIKKDEELKMQICCLNTDWASYDERGSDVTLYAAKEPAQADFEKEVSEELDRYGITDDNASDGYTMEKTEDHFEIYKDGEYLLDHSTIELVQLPVLEE